MTQIEDGPLVFPNLEAPLDCSEFSFPVHSFPLVLPLFPPKKDDFGTLEQNRWGSWVGVTVIDCSAI